MKYNIGCDAHKRYSQFAVLDADGKLCHQARVEHARGAIQGFLSEFPEGTPVALESVGNWYWIVDEIEASGCMPHMAHAVRAKVMMGHVDKTDKLDAKGLAVLLHNGTLPTVWIAPGEVRDERELHRTRMALCKLRTALKNRIHATLAKYNLSLPTRSDIFVPKWQPALQGLIGRLPPETGRCVHQELELLERLQDQIGQLERRLRERLLATKSMQLLQSLPGIGEILALVIEREIGAIERFPSAQRFASYSGTVPTTSASGGKVWQGRMRKQANQYLKWAFIEAANVIVLNQNHPRWRSKHIVRLYQRIRRRKGHAVAVGAVARHLSEAAYWVLRKQQPYRDPAAGQVAQTG
jgi:transposase